MSGGSTVDQSLRLHLFSHGEFGRSLSAHWIGLPVEQGEHLQLGTASLSILGFNPAHPGLRVIARWNSSARAADTVSTRPVPETRTTMRPSTLPARLDA